MEFRELIESLKRNWLLFLIVIILFLGLVSGIALTRPKKYEINFSLLISQTRTQQTQDFKYDTYYALEAKDKMGDYLVAFLKSPESVSSILDKADFSLKDFKTYDLRSFFAPYKASSQSIGVRFYLRNPSFAKNIINSLIEASNDSLAKTYIAQDKDASFEIKSTNPLVSLKKQRLSLIIIISLFVGFILGVLIVLVKEYMLE